MTARAPGPSGGGRNHQPQTRTPERDNVATYYNRNTRAFLRQGRSGSGALHRELWAPGVGDREAALAYVNTLVAHHLAGRGPLLDLGCGVAASALWLARRGLQPIHGLTNSTRQVELARQRVAAAGQSEAVTVIDGSFDQLPRLVDAAAYGGAYAIESFVHNRDARRWFAGVAHALRAGGRLVICDDFLRAPPAELPAAARRWTRRFARGWLAHGLATRQQAMAWAQAAGLELVVAEDLTPYHRYHRRLRRWLLRTLTTVTAWLPALPPLLASVTGGTALQICLEQGWIGHWLLVFDAPVIRSGQR